jgi:hypothetical protein
VSLWRKRKNCDNIAPNVVANVHHNEQKQDNLIDILNNLSIKSKDLSMQLKMWVDPPEGWRYGFPAIFDPVKDGKMRDWIISKGYPKQIIQEYGDSWAVRCWYAEEVKPSDK